MKEIASLYFQIILTVGKKDLIEYYLPKILYYNFDSTENQNFSSLFKMCQQFIRYLFDFQVHVLEMNFQSKEIIVRDLILRRNKIEHKKLKLK